VRGFILSHTVAPLSVLANPVEVMSGESIPQRLSVKTASGDELDAKCPVCAHDLFMSVRAKSLKLGVGFQHLDLGQEVLPGGKLGEFVSLPVRFHACANCGHILKFLMSRS
jgi:hypothetical protein